MAGNANDGNQASYSESADNAFPQWLQVDLGSSVSVNKVVLKLPDRADLGASTDDHAVTGYDVYLNGTLLTPVGGNVLTYTDTQAATAHRTPGPTSSPPRSTRPTRWSS